VSAPVSLFPPARELVHRMASSSPVCGAFTTSLVFSLLCCSYAVLVPLLCLFLGRWYFLLCLFLCLSSPLRVFLGCAPETARGPRGGAAGGGRV